MPTETARPAPPRGGWLTLPVLLTGTVLIVLDFFAVNVAIPAVQTDLHASEGAIEWVVAGYGVTFAAFIITAGRLADRAGRRRVLLLGLALFTVASAGCGLAPGVAWLIGWRLVQGMAAAMISPAVLSIIGVTYTGAARAKAISAYGMAMGVAAAGGQLVGGFLVQADIAGLGWRAVFLVNVPVGVLALALAPQLVPESRAEHARRLDPAGMVLATVGLGCVVLPLIEGRSRGWPAWTWMSLVAGIGALAAFAAHQRALARRGGAPLLDPALFADRAFRAGLITQLAYWCSQASFFLVLALYLQDGRGLDPLRAGLVFTVLAAAYLATSLRAPALTGRYGRDLIALGALVLAVGDVALLAAADGPIGLLLPGLLLVGAGQGLCITPLTTTVLRHADPARAGVVSGALSTMQQAGNALGVAITSVLFFAAVPGGYSHAFDLALAELTGLLLVVAALTRLLPSRKP